MNPQLMPFQLKHIVSPGNHMNIPDVDTVRSFLRSAPIFGGTSAESTTTTTDPAATTTTTENSAATTDPATTDPAAIVDPAQVADLIKQVTDLGNTVKTLNDEKSKAATEKATADRAKLGREQALEADLEDAQQTIIKMDAALKRQAVVNAINNEKEIEFHDVNFVLQKLDPTIMENMVVDLDNAQVTVTGVGNDLRRIAKENDWAVKKNNRPATNGNSGGAAGGEGKPPAQGSGAAPNGAVGGASKTERREKLLTKYPVIGHGRSPIAR